MLSLLLFLFSFFRIQSIHSSNGMCCQWIWNVINRKCRHKTHHSFLPWLLLNTLSHTVLHECGHIVLNGVGAIVRSRKNIRWTSNNWTIAIIQIHPRLIIASAKRINVLHSVQLKFATLYLHNSFFSLTSYSA